jgi:hypothetical protein
VQNLAAFENVRGVGPNWFTSLPAGAFRLLGRRLIVPIASQFGTQADALLIDRRSYLVGIRQDATLGVDRSIRFKASEVGFRLNCRINGQPALASAVTPRTGELDAVAVLQSITSNSSSAQNGHSHSCHRVWTFAAFGEEIAYRGYLLVRGTDVGARSKPAWWMSMLFVSILFGFGHYYKGPLRHRRVRLLRTGARVGVLARRSQPMGECACPWIRRHVGCRCAVLRTLVASRRVIWSARLCPLSLPGAARHFRLQSNDLPTQEGLAKPQLGYSK